MNDPRVLVVQSGARHNYALPAAFAEEGLLEAFYTDMCAGRGLGRSVNFFSQLPLPSNLKFRLKKLAGRRPPEKVLDRTCTDDLGSILYEWRISRLDHPRARREALIKHAFYAGKRWARRGLRNSTHLFNIFGEGGSLVVDAKSQGITILADIIIALSTIDINEAEYQAFPDWGPPPPDQLGLSYRGFDPVKQLLNLTDVFVCPSLFVAKDLVDTWGVRKEMVRIIPYALSDEWFLACPQPVPGRVLFVGSADRRKGIHYLAMAANELRARQLGYDFRIVGGAHDIVKERKDARPLTFVGQIPREKVREEFARADIFVLPTLAEGSATVVYEAMASGVPVITTPAAGSYVEDGVTGLLVPERDPTALASAIERLVEDRELRDRLAAAAQAKAFEFTWDRYREQMVSLVRGPIP